MHDLVDMSQVQRIIGVEIRYMAPDGETQEVALIPCDVKLPALHQYARGRITFTFHTTHGDVQSPYPLNLNA